MPVLRVQIPLLLLRVPQVREEMGKILGDDEFEEIFKIIDFDGSGEIGIDEFFDNISKVVTGSININDMRTKALIEASTNTLRAEIGAGFADLKNEIQARG